MQVFGPQSFTTTTRNMILDIRGEAAYAPNLADEMPVGASVSSLAMGAAINFADCEQGCGCLSNPAGIQLPGSVRSAGAYPNTVSGRQSKCEEACSRTSKNVHERTACVKSCAQDVPIGNRLAMAGSNQDLEQDCVTSCVATGGPSQGDCISSCRRMFGQTRGGSVLNVYPQQGLFTPSQIRPASSLRPYQS